MTNEQLRMQFIGGIISETEFKQKLEENKSPKNKKSLNENFVSIGAINNPFPERVPTDYELAFEYFTKGELNEDSTSDGDDLMGEGDMGDSEIGEGYGEEDETGENITEVFMEEEDIIKTLSKIYHIISNNRRDYLSFPDSLIDELKKISIPSSETIDYKFNI